jgi:uncharacterized protein
VTAAAPSARARLAELFARIDAFFDRVREREPGGLTCHAGCDDCCQRRLSVTGIEAEVIAEGLAGLPEDVRERASARAAAKGATACAALEPDGRCAIYAVRPVVCRTHGLPIRFAPPEERRSLPVIDACPKNFGGRDLASIDPACVLDQTTLSTVLGALDAAHAGEKARPRGERVDLASLLSRTPG